MTDTSYNLAETAQLGEATADESRNVLLEGQFVINEHA